MASFDAEEARTQLDRILTSDDFQASSRNRRFLAYVFEETLAGRAEAIKAYTIATCVFGRPPDFDPQIDSIVRIEAGRLRRCLERYYLTSGQADPIVISIPKGTYVPQFGANPNHQNGAMPTTDAVAHGSAGLLTSILVDRLEEEGDQSAFPNLTRGFTRRIVGGLSRFTDLAVFGPDGAAVPTTQPPAERVADFLLTGGTTVSSTQFSADLLLIETASGRCVWGERFECLVSADHLAASIDEIARTVVQALAQPYGAIFVATSRDVDDPAHTPMSSSASVLLYRRYARIYDLDLLESVRLNLEAAITRDPNYADAFSCLSLVYTDIVRYSLKPAVRDGRDPRERMFVLAHRAIDLAPNASHAHHALARAYWFSGDTEGSFEELKIAHELNPYDTAVLADLGHQHAMMANWDVGIPLLVKAYAENPGLPSWYRIAFAIHHFVGNRFESALAEVRKVNANRIIYPHLVTAACAYRLDRREEAAAALDRALAINPDFGRHGAEDLAKRNVHPAIAAALLEALADAGLSTGPKATGTPRLRSLTG